ncbi:MAG: phage major capsid protein, partial [Defluviicoccus sp.]|nr:phage major capsid protein [Defluviicoccus sp.]
AETESPDAEQRERIELRSKARLTEYLLARAQGRMVSGAEAELCAAAGVQGIPLELWDTLQPERRQDRETRAITPAPGTVGVNLDPIRPAVFANSIAPRLGIAMPRVGSGTYATGTITTSQSADAKEKSAAIAATAGAITVTTATPKRVSARLELTLEDIAAVGQANFESILRENLSLALSDELDDQAINGDGQAPNLSGMFKALTDPSAPAAGVATFDTFVAAFADGIDGLWANTLKVLAIDAGVDWYKVTP